jgi:cytidine deaminase
MPKEIEITSVLTSYNDVNELNKKDALLLAKAAEATKLAYAPYSEFRVGAAISFENGAELSGSNQENSSFPSGLCAERVVLFHAMHQFPNEKILAIAITIDSEKHPKERPVCPCGGCLQVLSDLEYRQKMPLRFILKGMGKEVWVIEGVKHLMPFRFLL